MWLYLIVFDDIWLFSQEVNCKCYAIHKSRPDASAAGQNPLQSQAASQPHKLHNQYPGQQITKKTQTAWCFMPLNKMLARFLRNEAWQDNMFHIFTLTSSPLPLALPRPVSQKKSEESLRRCYSIMMLFEFLWRPIFWVSTPHWQSRFKEIATEPALRSCSASGIPRSCSARLCPLLPTLGASPAGNGTKEAMQKTFQHLKRTYWDLWIFMGWILQGIQWYE